jgi:hypothetical protein
MKLVPGRKQAVAVRVRRGDYQGRIELHLDELGEGLTAEAGVIAEGESAGRVTVLARREAVGCERTVQVWLVFPARKVQVPLRVRVEVDREAQQGAVAVLRRVGTVEFSKDARGRPKACVTLTAADSADALAVLKDLQLPVELTCGANVAVRNAHLQHLQDLRELRGLVLLGGYRNVGDAGLKHLAGLTGLRRLNLAATAVSDAGLKHLAGLRELRLLSLGHCAGVSDRGLAVVGRLARLEALYLDGTGVSDAGLKHLRGLARLRILSLGHCMKVSDTGLGHLERLPRLAEVYLDFTAVSAAGVARLRKARPKLQVVR